MFGYACLVSAILCEHRRGSSACLVILCTHIESLSIVECDQARPDPQALVAAFIEWRPVRALPDGGRRVALRLIRAAATLAPTPTAVVIPATVSSSRPISPGRPRSGLGGTNQTAPLSASPKGYRTSRWRDVSSALIPFHMICTPIQTSRKDESRIMTIIAVFPSIRASRSANP